MINHLRVGERLALLSVIMILAVIFIGTIGLVSQKNSLLSERKTQTTNVVEVAYSTITYYAKMAESGEKTVEQAKESALKHLVTLRYDESNYFWINDTDTVVLAHPFAPQLIGKNSENLKDANGKKFVIELVKEAIDNGEGFVEYYWPKPEQDEPAEKISYVKYYEPWGWIVGSGVYVDDIDASFASDSAVIGGVLLVLLCLLGAASYFVSRSITRPLGKMARMMDLLAKGDPSGNMPILRKRSEMGIIFRSLNQLKDATISAFRIEVALQNSATNIMVIDNDNKIDYLNDALQKLLFTLKQDIQKHIPNFNADNLVNVDVDIFKALPGFNGEKLKNLSGSYETCLKIGQHRLDLIATPVISDTAQRMGLVFVWEDRTKDMESQEQWKEIEEEKISNERDMLDAQSAQALKMADLLEDQVITTIKMVVSSTEEMEEMAGEMSSVSLESSTQSRSVSTASADASESVQSVASESEKMSNSISEISKRVFEAAESAKSAVVEANSADVTVQGLSKASEKIGEVVSLIQDIAGQTNLLALNATIEAARAGDAGKGFAVVAAEVKNLASQTATATEVISTQIKEIQSATIEAVSGIRSVSGAVEKIDEISTEIAQRIDEQASVTGSISQNAQSAAVGTAKVSRNISDIADGSRDIGNAAKNVLHAAQGLGSLSDRLNKVIDQYLIELRESTAGNRRRHTRHEFPIPVEIKHKSGAFSCEIADLSVKAVRIVGNKPLEIEEEVEIEVPELGTLFGTVLRNNANGTIITYTMSLEQSLILDQIIAENEAKKKIEAEASAEDAAVEEEEDMESILF